MCVQLRLFFCSFLFLATSYVTYIGESPIEYTHKMCKVLHATIFEMCVLHGDQRYNKTSIGSTLNRWWFLPFLFTLSFWERRPIWMCVCMRVYCYSGTYIVVAERGYSGSHSLFLASIFESKQHSLSIYVRVLVSYSSSCFFCLSLSSSNQPVLLFALTSLYAHSKAESVSLMYRTTEV